MSYWVTFSNHEPVCVNVFNRDDALRIAAEETGADPVDARGLPYTANPQVGKDRWEAWCHSPETCAGYSSCPHKYACSN